MGLFGIHIISGTKKRKGIEHGYILYDIIYVRARVIYRVRFHVRNLFIQFYFNVVRFICLELYILHLLNVDFITDLQLSSFWSDQHNADSIVCPASLTHSICSILRPIKNH